MIDKGIERIRVNPRKRQTRYERAEHDKAFPGNRVNCVDGPRPCPWLRCRYHLALTVKRGGSITVDHNAMESESNCALDVAEEGAQTLERIGALMGISKQSIQYTEVEAIEKLRRRLLRKRLTRVEKFCRTLLGEP